MQYASKLLTEEEICRVNVAIEQAQGRTSARIVPVIATSSVRYDRVEDMVGLWAAALGLALLCMFLSGAPLSKDWSLPGRVWGTGLLLVLGIISAGFIGGALLGTRIGWLRRLFLTQRKMKSAVQERARQVFSRHLVRYNSEDDSKLVLIYVSLCEHDVVVLSSDTLQGQFDPREIDTIREAIITGIAKRRPTQGLCAGIFLLGNLLGSHCPAPQSDTGQLKAGVTLLE